MRDTPAHWMRGALLDVKRYTDGTFRAWLLGEADTEGAPSIEFSSGWDAQQFVSAWYSRELAREPVWGSAHPMQEVFEPMTPSSHVVVTDASNAAPMHTGDV